MSTQTDTRLPQENPRDATLADAKIGFLWLCLDSGGATCAAMRNVFGEVTRVNPTSPADWFRSVRPPRDFKLLRPIELLEVDFSRVHD